MRLFIIISTVGLTATIFGCGQNKQQNNDSDNMDTQPITKPVVNIKATRDQRERRDKSEAICKSHNVPIYANPNSLFVDPEAEVSLRSKDEIVDRALALCYIGLKSEGLE